MVEVCNTFLVFFGTRPHSELIHELEKIIAPDSEEPYDIYDDDDVDDTDNGGGAIGFD
jgi:hypothetical protein